MGLTNDVTGDIGPWIVRRRDLVCAISIFTETDRTGDLMTQAKRDLERFFNPRSIAILGASSNLKSISGKPLRFLLDHGYKGKIFPINPKYDEIGGFRCYKSVMEVPEEIDAALLAVNYRLVLPMLQQCVEKGIKFATVFASGFAESGAEGKELQRQIGELAQKHGIGLCGPNCQGMVNLRDGITGGFSASLEIKPLIAGPIGYVTQSGALGFSIFNMAQESGVGFNFIASTGNEVDLHTLDFMEYILDEPSTTMVIAYIEGIKSGQQFERLADRAIELGKPICVLKVGRSAIGQKAAASHTGSLTGSDAVFEAFFKQKGIIRADDIEDLIDVASLMQRIPGVPKGKGLGIITTSGGAGILAADTAADLGLDIPEMPPATKAAIMEVVPPYGSALNPVDVTAQVINVADDFIKVMQAMVVLDEIDALVIVVTMISGAQGAQMARDIVKMSKLTSKPLVVAWTAGERLMGDNLSILREGGVQLFQSPVRAVKAMGRLMQFGAFRASLLQRRGAETEAQTPAQVKANALAILAGADHALTEHQGKLLLAEYGIPVTGEGVATSAENAVELAEGMGYPVVMKIDSPDIMHKTEAGGLKLNIRNADEVRTAFAEIMGNARAYNAKAKLCGVLVQEMVTGGTEVIVGLNNDPQFGPTVMFGLGGIFVEIMKDVSLRVAPLAHEDAVSMIREIKSYPILAGARGRAKLDVDAIADVLMRVSRLALDLREEVAELDINPLIVLPQGRGVRVADALVVKR